jgi:hypothetical protein
VASAREFVRRAAFALIACLAWHDREAPDERFATLRPVIMKASTDERNYVRKSVNWALRHIGKRNTALNKAALAAAWVVFERLGRDEESLRFPTRKGGALAVLSPYWSARLGEKSCAPPGLAARRRDPSRGRGRQGPACRPGCFIPGGGDRPPRRGLTPLVPASGAAARAGSAA